MPRRRGRRAVAKPVLVVAILLAIYLQSRDRGERPQGEAVPPPIRPFAEEAPYQAEIEEGVGAAVAILIDTSGSMENRAPGDTRSKYLVALAAVAEMLDATDAFLERRPDFAIRVAVLSFASQPWRILPIQPYDPEAVRQGLARVPQPGGGTAIGEAMRAARPELYRSGVYRKYLVVVTDGENTSGRRPSHVAREIHRKSEGAVQVYFVAFDTSAAKFSFLQEVGGEVIPARNAEQLRAALDEIYQGKILAEAMDTGEFEPEVPR
jgi:Mg-chelatase subunit ChlD